MEFMKCFAKMLDVLPDPALFLALQNVSVWQFHEVTFPVSQDSRLDHKVKRHDDDECCYDSH